MAVAKKAISKIANAIPRINKVLSSLAIAVIAMTLSRDIDTSAIIIVINYYMEIIKKELYRT